jgi:hypothetical protein
MANPTKSKKPAAAAMEKPPETHKQTKALEDRLPPQRNTTEPYGKSSEDASRSAAK